MICSTDHRTSGSLQISGSILQVMFWGSPHVSFIMLLYFGASPFSCSNAKAWPLACTLSCCTLFSGASPSFRLLDFVLWHLRLFTYWHLRHTCDFVLWHLRLSDIGTCDKFMILSFWHLRQHPEGSSEYSELPGFVIWVELGG